jgi:hypothetical protein
MSSIFVQVASAVTPVPGGVGPMTIAAVLHNTLEAAKQSNTLRAQSVRHKLTNLLDHLSVSSLI